MYLLDSVSTGVYQGIQTLTQTGISITKNLSQTTQEGLLWVRNNPKRALILTTTAAASCYYFRETLTSKAQSWLDFLTLPDPKDPLLLSGKASRLELFSKKIVNLTVDAKDFISQFSSLTFVRKSLSNHPYQTAGILGSLGLAVYSGADPEKDSFEEELISQLQTLGLCEYKAGLKKGLVKSSKLALYATIVNYQGIPSLMTTFSLKNFFSALSTQGLSGALKFLVSIPVTRAVFNYLPIFIRPILASPAFLASKIPFFGLISQTLSLLTYLETPVVIFTAPVFGALGIKLGQHLLFGPGSPSEQELNQEFLGFTKWLAGQPPESLRKIMPLAELEAHEKELQEKILGLDKLTPTARHDLKIELTWINAIRQAYEQSFAEEVTQKKLEEIRQQIAKTVTLSRVREKLRNKN